MGLPHLQAFGKWLQTVAAGSEVAHGHGTLQATVKGTNLFMSPDCLSLTSHGKAIGGSDANHDSGSAAQLASAGIVPVLSEFDANICCSKCHNADYKGKTAAMKDAVAQVTQNCNLCHFSKPAQ
jgi:hypothetical protein